MKYLEKINKVGTIFLEKIKRINIKNIEFLIAYYRAYKLKKEFDEIVMICNPRPEKIDRSVYNLLTDAEMNHKRELLRNRQLSEEEKLIFIEELEQVSLFNKRLHLGYSLQKAGKLVGKKCTKEEEYLYIKYIKHISVGLGIDLSRAERFCVGVFNVEDYLKGLI